MLLSRIPWVKVLIGAMVLVAVFHVAWGIDFYVRWRIAQFLNAYHEQVIRPLTRPGTPAPAVKPGG